MTPQQNATTFFFKKVYLSSLQDTTKFFEIKKSVPNLHF